MSGRTQVATGTRRTQDAPPGRRTQRASSSAGRVRPARAGVTGGRTRSGPAPVRRRPPVRARPPVGAQRTRSPQQRASAAAADLARTSRTPFVFLLVGLLGGGLLCLLLINTILDTGSYQITQLQQQNVTLAQRTQTLQAQIAHEVSPTVLAERARQLGMREPGLLHFLDLRKGRIASEPGHVPDVPVWPPGYTP
jgi:cell division protein FtsB